MQTKQHAKRKQHSYSNRKKIYKEQFVFVFVVEGSLAGNVQNTGFFKIQLVGSVCSILSVMRGSRGGVGGVRTPPGICKA